MFQIAGLLKEPGAKIREGNLPIKVEANPFAPGPYAFNPNVARTAIELEA